MTSKIRAAIEGERRRTLDIVKAESDRLQLFISEYSEDTEMAVWTMVAILDDIRRQINEHPSTLQRPDD